MSAFTPQPSGRDGLDWAIGEIEADRARSADTHRIKLSADPQPAICVYLKNKSRHSSRSFKHSLARSLFLYALCNSRIGPETAVIERSSGSTAISDAYFARLLGLRFIAIPAATAPAKLAEIERLGGTCRPGPASDIYAAAQNLTEETGGHYMDQFTNAERATDWRGNNNIVESIFDQMANERFPIPSWIVVGAGTGGTSATIGRFIRYRRTC